MKAKNTKWLLEEDKILFEFYHLKGPAHCATMLERSRSSISDRAKYLNLKVSEEVLRNKSRKYTKEMLLKATQGAQCYSDVLRNLGVNPQAGNFRQLKKNLHYFNINVEHFLTSGQLTSIRQNTEAYRNKFIKKPVEDYLFKGSGIRSATLKEKLYEAGLKKPVCEMCGQKNEWHGKNLIMILDHIDGNHENNELKNLRILCPNCNSTLDTHCSKNRKNINKTRLCSSTGGASAS